jgi:putative ABC transport system permease protein
MIRTAVRELRRKPGRFVVATFLIAFLTVLALLLGALLDGLFLGSTGAIRTQRADVFVYSADSRESFLRSRITPELRAQVEAVEGVTETGGLGFALVGAQVPGETELADVAVVGYELATDGVPSPPPPGEAWADRRLEAFGVDEGDTLLLGPRQVPVSVAGWVEDSNYLLQGGLWVEPGTWRGVQNASRPDAAVADGVFQSLVVTGDLPPSELAQAIDAGTGGATSSLTKDEAVLSLPGTREQQATFNLILAFTYLVVLIVVALFFALLVRERTGLIGVFKAMGASTWQVAAGLVLQAVLVSAIAFAVGWGLVRLLALVIPPGIPAAFESSRAVTTLAVIVLVALVGSALSLRRVAKIDPASAIGGAA